MTPGDEAPRPPATPRRGRWQLGLRAVILLVLAAALGSSIAANRRRVAELAPRIDRLRPLARELDVADPGKFAAIRRLKEDSGIEGWDVHIPEGRTYRICLATRGIDHFGPVAPQRTAPIAPGRHTLRLVTRHDKRGTRFDVLDGSDRRLAIEEPKGWAHTDSSSSQSLGAKTIPSPADRPLVLIGRRYMMPDPAIPKSFREPREPAEGLMLWIEPADGGKPAPPVR